MNVASSSTVAAGIAARQRRLWLLTLPALILLFCASFGPLLVVALYSFLTAGEYSGVEWTFTLDAWRQVFWSRDIFDEVWRPADAHLSIFWRSVRLALLTTLITLLLGFPTAWFVATRSSGTRALWLFLISVPFWTNLLIRTFAIMEMIRNQGVLNTLLIWSGATTQPVQILYTDVAVLIGMAYVYLPLMVLPLYAAMERIDLRLVEAAYDLYASRLRVLRRVILPQVRPGLVAGSILVFVPAIGAYVTPRVLGGGRNLMLGNLIELQFGQGRNWPLGAALSMTLLIIVAVALTLYVRLAEDDDRHG